MITLDKLIDRIEPKNPVMARAKSVLDSARKPHNQSESYAAAVYLFAGWETELAMNTLRWGLAENSRYGGPGLGKESVVGNNSRSILHALDANKNKIPKILVYSSRKCNHLLSGLNERGPKNEEDEKIEEQLWHNIFRYVNMTKCYGDGIEYKDAVAITDFFCSMPAVAKNSAELVLKGSE